MLRPLLITSVAAAALSGCAVANLVGGAAQNAEYQKLIEVPPQYDGLSGQKVAVLVNVNMTMMYEHPRLAGQVALGVAYNIRQKVANVRVIAPEQTMQWQSSTPHWHLMSYGDIADDLGATRIILIDIYEYRLTPPGNRYEWDGVCAAHVRVIEADGINPDPMAPAEEFNVIAKFPDQQGVTWESTNASQISQGLVLKFIQKVAWLFYLHEEPKYPDKYNPRLEQPRKK